MFNPSRDAVRQFFCTTRRKRREGLPLEGAELVAASLIDQHPEYHALLDAPELALQQEWLPESGQMNPFLHLSLHLAVAEQVSIDQPPGVRAAYQRLSNRLGDTHAAEHRMLDCLGAAVFQAQRTGHMDAEAYLESLQRAAAGPA